MFVRVGSAYSLALFPIFVNKSENATMQKRSAERIKIDIFVLVGSSANATAGRMVEMKITNGQCLPRTNAITGNYHDYTQYMDLLLLMKTINTNLWLL